MNIKASLRRQLESYVATVKSKGTAQNWKKHLRSWPVYAAAGGSSLAFVSAAGAGIISSGPLNVTVGFAPGGTGIPPGGSAHVRIGSASFSELAQGFNNLPNSANGFLQVNMYPNPSRGKLIDFTSALTVRRFGSGAVISQNVGGNRTNFGVIALRAIYPNNPGSNRTFGTWPVGKPGFVGIELDQPDGVHFGWVKMTWGADADGIPNSETILGWAYNDVAGAPITTPTPAPGAMTMALLGAGCAGVLAWRRRRKIANAEAAS